MFGNSDIHCKININQPKAELIPHKFSGLSFLQLAKSNVYDDHMSFLFTLTFAVKMLRSIAMNRRRKFALPF